VAASADLREFMVEWANWEGLRTLCITFDVDFAPDYMLDEVLEVLDRYDAPATFFATHKSERLQELAAGGRHEVGLHPYTGPGTTQGGSLEAIVADLRGAYPDAVGNRFHVLHHSYRDLVRLGELGFRYDVSTLRFDTPYLLPALHRDLGLVLLTYAWEDGIAENANVPLVLAAVDVDSPGLKIFNFHPMNVFVNGERHRRTGAGAATFLVELLEHATSRDCRLTQLTELADAFAACVGATI
jgi:peptidoglycan/xylan/chitin deacetylase (PgdA/CDA1 family)